MIHAETFLKMGREVLAQQPFSVLLGAELLALEPRRHCAGHGREAAREPRTRLTGLP